MNKAVFFGWDVSAKADLYINPDKKEAFNIRPTAIEALAMLSKTDYKLIIISNQARTEKRARTEKDIEKINDHLSKIITEKVGKVDRIYSCPHAPEDACECRKPGIGLLMKARDELRVDLKRSFFITDDASNIETGRRAGCTPILVITGQGRINGQFKVKADFVAENLLEAASIVLRNTPSSKIRSRKEIRDIAREQKRKGKKIVTCNGSFDIFHIGHLQFLQEAKAQGDILIVGLNSDDSVKRYKSPDRPIISEEDRAELLAGLGCVDFVTLFDETDPLKLLEIIKPDVHVNGAEYGKDCIEARFLKSYGARLHLIRKNRGLSTTKIIEMIKRV